jgi:cell wall-associated NlpC family hydrolase
VFKEGNSLPKVGLIMMALALLLAAAVVGSATLRSKAVRSYADLRRGDLVYFAYEGGAGYIHHVGMYVGGGRMIHSPNPSRGVETISIKRSGLIKEYAGAIRYY